MKRTYKRAGCSLLLACLLFLLSFTPALAAYPDAYFTGGQNYIRNPGFEQGLAYWDATGIVTLGKGCRGRYSAAIGETPDFELEQTVTLPHAGKYVLRAYTKSSGAAPASQAIGVSIKIEHDFYGTIMHPVGSWQMMESSFTITEEFVNQPLEFAISGLNCEGALIDEIVLAPADALPAPNAPEMEKNLQPNPGFEEGVSDWSVVIGNAPIEKGQIAHTGKKSLFVDASEASYTSILSPVLPPLQKGLYEITVNIFVPSQRDSEGNFDLFLVTMPNNEMNIHNGATFSLKADNAWHEVRFSTYLDSVENLRVYLQNSTSSSYFLDDVSVIPLDTPQGNLLENPGFETGLAGWNAAGSAATATTAQSDTGLGAAQLTYAALAPMEDTLAQTCPVTQAGTYTASARILPGSTLAGGGGLLLLEARDKNGNLLASSASQAVSGPQGEWGLVETTLTVPEDTATLTVKLGGAYCTGTFYVDSACLVRWLDE